MLFGNLWFSAARAFAISSLGDPVAQQDRAQDS